MRSHRLKEEFLICSHQEITHKVSRQAGPHVLNLFSEQTVEIHSYKDSVGRPEIDTILVKLPLSGSIILKLIVNKSSTRTHI